jgi:hypothetical protein
MMPHGENWGAPSVIAAFAGFVHDRESTANYERNDDNDSYYGSVHCNLPATGPKGASQQGQHDENANGDVIGNEHGIPTAQIAPNHLSGIFPHHSHAYFGPATILNLYRITHSESTVVKWDNSPSAKL